jgi:signal transduction histidine kinase
MAVALNGPAVEIVLADNGSGMTSDQLAAAFQPFVTTRLGSTGLGLPIARQIACAHGTDIHISRSPAEGTRCSVSFSRIPPS